MKVFAKVAGKTNFMLRCSEFAMPLLPKGSQCIGKNQECSNHKKNTGAVLRVAKASHGKEKVVNQKKYLIS